jgi:hypothetical protein
MRKRNATAFLAVLGLSVLASTRGDLTTPQALRADPVHPLVDTDGDLLPDILEWSSLTHPYHRDSDGDGSDDFFDVVNNRVRPLSIDGERSGPNPPPNGPNAARVLVSTTRGTDRPSVLMNLMFHFGPQQAPHVQLLHPFLDVRGVQVPIQTIVMSSTIQVAMRNQQAVGWYVLVTARICALDELRPLLPCTIGALVVIDGVPVITGTPVMDVGGLPAAIMPVSNERFALHAVQPPQDVRNPFWTDNKACVFELVQIGATESSILCEIMNPDCVGAAALCCDPGGCRSKNGGVVALPGGLNLLK